MSLEKYYAYIKSKSDGALSSQCNNYAKKQIIKNREVLTSIISGGAKGRPERAMARFENLWPARWPALNFRFA